MSLIPLRCSLSSGEENVADGIENSNHISQIRVWLLCLEQCGQGIEIVYVCVWHVMFKHTHIHTRTQLCKHLSYLIYPVSQHWVRLGNEHGTECTCGAALYCNSAEATSHVKWNSCKLCTECFVRKLEIHQTCLHFAGIHLWGKSRRGSKSCSTRHEDALGEWEYILTRNEVHQYKLVCTTFP